VVFAAADLQQPKLERRSAEVLLIGVICGLAVFLLHNFIDFSLFETGLFYLFVTLAAAAIGMRSGEPAGEGRGGLLMLAAWVLLAGGFAIVVTAPVVQGELANRRGDLLYADRRPAQAQREYVAAFEGSAWLANAEYLLREGRAQAAAGDRLENVLATVDRAIQANPRFIPVRLVRASILSSMHQADAVVKELQQVYRLNPNDVGIRLDAGEFLARLGRNDLACEQYQAALDNNARLPADEPKRLPAARVAEIEAKIMALSARP
jgi:tetratricopeptide (TPR) repeat protein